MPYQHVLCTIDLREGSETVAQRAHEIATRNGARMSLMHVVEYMPYYMGDELALPNLQPIEDQLVEHARVKVAKIAASLQLPADICHIVVGVTRVEILRYAEAEGVDLIVVGRHVRHGLERLLGSTAGGIVATAPCDVLTVKTA